MSNVGLIGRVPLETREFEALRRIIRDAAGIHMGDQKRDLVAGRLQSRLRELRLGGFADYIKYLAADATGDETRQLVNCITTNKTSFFREPHHFDFIRDRLVPEVLHRGQRKLRIWSAACSMGHEPWSIAMTLASALGSFAGWDVKILASDLDTEVLATAEAATYDDLAVEDVPAALRAKYLESAPNGMHRVVSSLRSLVTFRRMNLVQPQSWQIRGKFDLVMCRNVAIYFDRPTQELVFKSLTNTLEPTGYLMSGHSENLHWLSDTLTPIGQTIHVRTGNVPAAPKSGTRPAVRALLQAAAATSPVIRAQLPPPPPPAPVAPAAPEIAIQVGGVHASDKGAIIRTTLGSCIAVCMYDPERRVGGMNHFLLPQDNGSGGRTASHFGINAMELLINGMMKLGAERSRLVAKVFGGGATMGSALSSGVGRRNADFALSFLADEGIPVAAKKVCASTALSVLFDSGTGVVRVKEVGSVPELYREEQKVMARLSLPPPPVDQDITFFGLP